MVQQEWTPAKISSIKTAADFREHLADNISDSRNDLPGWCSIVQKDLTENPELTLGESCKLKFILTENGKQCIAIGYVQSPIGTPDTRKFVSNISDIPEESSNILSTEEFTRRLNHLDLDDSSSLRKVFEAKPIEKNFAKEFQRTINEISSIFKSENGEPQIDALSIVLLAVGERSKKSDTIISTYKLLESVEHPKAYQRTDDRSKEIWRRIEPGSLNPENTIRDIPTQLSNVLDYDEMHIREASEVVDQFVSKFEWQISMSQNHWDISHVSVKVIGDAFERYLTQQKGEYSTPAEFAMRTAERTVHSIIKKQLSQYDIESAGTELGLVTNDTLDNSQRGLEISESDAERVLTDVLPNLRIADIATGSGTYLVAVFDTLARVWKQVISKADTNAISSLDGVPDEIADEDLIIQGLWITGSRILCGVDIDKQATLLTRFRLNLCFQSSKACNQIETPLRLAHTILRGNSIIGYPYSEQPPHWNGQLPLSYWISDIESDVAAEQLTASPRTEAGDLSKYIENYYTAENGRKPIHEIDNINRRFCEKLDKQVTDRQNRSPEDNINEAGEKNNTTEVMQFNWGAEFKNIFEKGGFDAVIFQSPWHNKKLSTRKGDPGVDFIKKGGQYSLPPAKGWYRTSFDVSALMLHRAHDIVREGGAITAVLPTENFQNPRKRHFRHRYLQNTSIDIVGNFLNQTTFENIDRRYKFSLLMTEAEGETTSFRTRSGIVSMETVFREELVEVSKELVEGFSPKTLAFPPIKNKVQKEALASLCEAPVIGGPADINNPSDYEGWALSMKGELNTTRDNQYIIKNPVENSRSIYQGKDIGQFGFNHGLERSESDLWTIPPSADGFPTVDYLFKKWEKHKDTNQSEIFPPSVPRVVYRRIATSSNERTMIATLLPPGRFHTDSIRSINPRLSDYGIREKLVLISLLNSIPFDYLLRKKVDSDIRDYLLHETRLPKPKQGTESFKQLWKKAARLLRSSYPEPNEFIGRHIDITPEFINLCLEEDVGKVNEKEKRRQLRAEIDAIAFQLFRFESTEKVESLLDDFDYVRDPSLMDRYYRQQILEIYRSDIQ